MTIFKKSITDPDDILINNIVQKVKYELDYVSTLVPISETYTNGPYTKYYFTSPTDITNFVSSEYYDYLSSIDGSIWKKYKKQILCKFEHLKITTIPVLDLFVEKLHINPKLLFEKVKLNPSNHKLSLCVIIRYYWDFIESFENNTCDWSFFMLSLENNDLEFNKYIYHNIYCVLKINFNQCPYEKIFSTNSTFRSLKFINVAHFDVFEYFVNLFDVNIELVLNCNRIHHYVILALLEHYEKNTHKTDEYMQKPCSILKRMVKMSNIDIKEMCLFVENSINNTFGNTNHTKIYRVRFDLNSIVGLLIINNMIGELIDLLNYLNLDLKKCWKKAIIRMTIDILFSNDEESIKKFLQYLYATNYPTNYDFYAELTGLLVKQHGKYKYLHVGENLKLDKYFVKELYKMRYAGMKLKIT